MNILLLPILGYSSPHYEPEARSAHSDNSSPFQSLHSPQDLEDREITSLQEGLDGEEMFPDSPFFSWPLD